jgi:hypothetical protein
MRPVIRVARFDDVVDRGRIGHSCLEQAVGALVRSAGAKADWPTGHLVRALAAALPEALDVPLPDAFRHAAAARARTAAEVEIDAPGERRFTVRIVVRLDAARRAGAAASARRVDWRVWLGPAGTGKDAGRGAWQDVAHGSRWLRGIEPG